MQLLQLCGGEHRVVSFHDLRAVTDGKNDTQSRLIYAQLKRNT